VFPRDCGYIGYEKKLKTVRILADNRIEEPYAMMRENTHDENEKGDTYVLGGICKPCFMGSDYTENAMRCMRIL